MTAFRRAWSRLISSFTKPQLDQEFDEELTAHIELATQDFMRAGMSPREARRHALIKLGGVEPVKEMHRDTRGLPWLDGVLQDIHYAIRGLRRSPGFTAVAVLSLALGIGANTAIFTLIESTLLRPIAVKHLESLRLLTWLGVGGGWVAPNLGSQSPSLGWLYEQRETANGGLLHAEFSPPIYQQFLHANTVFHSLFAYKELGRATAAVDGSAEAVNCFLVSGDFYRGLELSTIIGRAIGPEQDVPTSDGAVAIISYEYWTRRFNRDPAVIGKIITLNAVPLTIIGVNPEYFTGIVPGAHFEIYAPLHVPSAIFGKTVFDNDRGWSIPMMGRLKLGVSDAEAQSQMDALFQAQVDKDYSAGSLAAMLKDPAKRPHLFIASAARGMDYLTNHYEQLLRVLLFLASLVLLIACANVANLLLAKSAERQREISLRLALGAGRWRIARQLFTEGLLLAGLAGIVGVMLGYAARSGIPALLATPWKPSPFETSFDPQILLVSIGITFLTGMLFSLAPVWQSRRVDVNEALKEGSRGTASHSKLRTGRLLVVLQVALSVLLLAGAGLCVKTFTNLSKMPLGLRPEGVLLFALDPPRMRYPVDRLPALLTELQDRFNTPPGIQAASYSGNQGGAYVSRGNQTPETTARTYAASLAVGSRFFDALGIPILSGRAIDEHDEQDRGGAAGALNLVVVNQTFVQQFFKDQNPIGRTFRGDASFERVDPGASVLYQIVGVCADWHSERLRDPIRPTFYNAFAQAPRNGSLTFEVKLAGNATSVQTANVQDALQQIRAVVRSVDSGLTINDVRTETQQIQDNFSQERLTASLAAIFGGLALLLASIGIYGVIAYGVARRTNEIGIRIALGARPSGVAWMVLRETLALAAIGLLVGIPAAVGLTPLLDHTLAPPFRENFAYGMKPNDPLILAAAVLALIVACATAGYLPARRASRIDPMGALRHD